MRLGVACIAAGLGAVLPASCTHREPPAPEGAPSIALPEPIPASPPPAAPPTPPTPPTPAMPATPATPATIGANPLRAVPDPALLPQTRDVPHASGPAFESRVAALWSAIVEDDPERGMSFFFPVAAYEQVKDIGDPATDWKRRLVAAYARDIHALHAHLAEAGARARLIALDVPEPRARWVEPGEEYNKIGYFRVFGSKLRYEDAGDAGGWRTFEVKSLISWRGEWYVVHLSAIK
jgi:hypothetical protein